MNEKRKSSLVRDHVSFKVSDGVRRLRKFCRAIEKNMNNFINPENIHDSSRDCKGYFIKIESINGIKKVFKGGKKPTEGKFFLRFFMTFFNQRNSQFIGNTYKSPLLKMSFNETGHYELAEQDSFYVYFLTRKNDNLGASEINLNPTSLTGSNLGRSPTVGPPQTKCILEIIFVEASNDDRIISQTCEGWGILDITTDETVVSPKGMPTNVYLGTPRYLLQKSVKSLNTINGASIMYSCNSYKEIEHLRFLIPNYVILGYNEAIPGLFQRFLPKQPILNEVIKTSQFYDIYLKNVEFEISPQVENKLIQFATSYRKQKYNITNNSFVNPVVIKERKLKCGVHNTWCFINSNGLENTISLSKKENFLFHKGVLHIDNFFSDETCSFAFIIELSYTLAIPCSDDNKEEILNMIIGYSILVPDQINNENNFLSANLITGPGETVYGEHLWDPIEHDDRIIKINFILSRNKDSYDKTYKEKEIEELRNQMQVLKSQMKIEYDKMLTSKDKEKEILLKKKEMELAELEAKYEESHRSLKAIYDKEVNRSPTTSINQTPKVFETKKFLVEEESIAPTEYIPSFGQIKSQRQDESRLEVNHSRNIQLPSDNKEISKDIPGNNNNYNLIDNNVNHLERNIQYSPIQGDSNFLIAKPEPFKNKTQTSFPHNNRYDILPDDKFDPEEYHYFKSFMEFKKNGKKMSEFFEQNKRELDDEDNNKKIIYDKTTNDISRRDKADLISKGILGLDIQETSQSLLTYTMDKELNDQYKANVYTMHFLAFKPTSEIKEYKSVPNRIFFRFSFWDFENFTTNVAVVNKPSAGITPSSTPLVLSKEGAPLQSRSEEKEMKIQIEYDPSIHPNVDFKDFINFLMTKQIFMEVIDAEKLTSVGFIKIPLKDFLRQGKQSVLYTKEYEIYDNKFNTKGCIQILLKSVGKNTFKPFNYDPNMHRVVNTKDRFNSIHRKKKVRVNPMDLDKISAQEKEYIAKQLLENKNTIEGLDSKSLHLKLNVDPETEKRLRVMKHLNTHTGSKVTLHEDKLAEIKHKQDKESEFYKKLNYANKVKELKKPEIISSTIKANNHNDLSISLIMGNPHFINFIVHNNYETDDLFYLHISQGKENSSDKKVEDSIVSFVNSPEEWKYYTEHFKLIKPNDYNSISPQNYLVIKPNESIPVLIKLLSYDQKMDKSDYTVWVHKKNGQPLFFLTITIVKVFPVIDHTFNMFFPENKYATVKIPNPFRFDKIKTQKLLDNYVSSNPEVNLQQDTITNNFFFKAKMLSQGHTNSFFISLYLDNKRTTTFATWKFELNSMESLELHTQIGSKITNKLAIEAERTARTVQFFSSNNEIIFFPEKFNSPIVLIPGMSNEVKYVVYPKTEEQEEVIVNCVDIANREIVRGWLIRVLPDKPEINQIFKVDCKVNSVTNIKYEFTNPLSNWMIFNFDSNNPDVLSVIDARMPFNANEKKYINIRIHSQQEVGRTEVLVFVSDSEEMYSEIILFQLNYK